jgi:hypothetical protein
MPTIVEYTDVKRPRNQYPTRIVSPMKSASCCFSEMEEIGEPHQDGRWIFQYKRCKSCGFTSRTIVRELPDEALIKDLRATLQNSFVRNIPNF